MKRIDFVYQKIRELSQAGQTGITAQDLAELLCLNRANVSHDLNKLWKEGKVTKSTHRPVLFSAIETATPLSLQRATSEPSLSAKKDSSTISNDENVSWNFQKYRQEPGISLMEQLAKDCQSLRGMIEQAKAALLYPPNGMHTLLFGETGVGKTMFAGVMHEYAVDKGILSEEAPFITFNCADYANNPQLLVSQLFGVTKGAYTGADRDREGLIEVAQGGILFLDEVHRLPSEGQEMLFTFIDKGFYRRMGETNFTRQGQVRLIAATTENPDSALLATFTRRIPMIIQLPSLKERGLEERLQLVVQFFHEESYRLGKDIHISSNTVRALLLYQCPNNIGQLKADIRLSCAKAYVDYISLRKTEIQITTSDLPMHVKEGLLHVQQNRKMIEKLLGDRKYYTFHPDQEPYMLEDSSAIDVSIYERMEQMSEELRANGITDNEAYNILDSEIDKYFTSYLKKVRQGINQEDMLRILHPEIVHVVEDIVSYAETRLNRKLTRNVLLGMSLHIQTLIDRVKKGKKISNPQLNQISMQHKREFLVALECVSKIEEAFDLEIQLDEAGFLTMFFVHDDVLVEEKKNYVGIIVMMHGNTSASSMVDVINRLLNTSHALALDMPLEKQPQEILTEAMELAKKMNRDDGLLLLVDMGSLLTFGDMISKELGMEVKVIPLVSTTHVLEATRKAISGASLDSIYQSVLAVSSHEFMEQSTGKERKKLPKQVIVTACLTGEGSALVIKNLLKHYLRFQNDKLQIIPITCLDQDGARRELEELKKERYILCTVSNFRIDPQVQHYNIEQVLSLQAIHEIQQLIDNEEIYQVMGETLEMQLKHLPGERVLGDIRGIISEMEKEIKQSFTSDELVGITLHMCCMLDRLKGGESVTEFRGKEEYILRYRDIFLTIQNVLRPLEMTYGVRIEENEICYLVRFFAMQEAGKTLY
ncbi:sigma 54-interacting transcriptional regulator [Brevibacillus daliensis]|uniref:sigma 54-interacting transcriptional regulator n=1 Tax=Brevibacillus daliensis TaxID=2892995 RepID=UPI001E5A0C45|nr:sigma-54-dependent transcriptional regulator [Brevibacillus daliensis]